MIEFMTDNTFLKGIWHLVSILNGNPEFDNNGITLVLGMFFSMFLLVVIQMRALSTMGLRHIIGMIGALLLFIRYSIMFLLDWGYQINLYDDRLIFLLSPPLEHFFFTMGLGCIAYYSLNYYQYYPGLLKKILWGIPIFITAFFIYASITWKIFFMSLNVVLPYRCCSVDWQSHLIITIMALYVSVVSLFKYSRTSNHYLSIFWFMTFGEQLARTIAAFTQYETSLFVTVCNGLQLWAIPILILHFVKIYVVKLGFCEKCENHEILENHHRSEPIRKN